MIDSKIALIHATQLAIAPAVAAFEEWWPQARRMNLLDDRLAADLADVGTLDSAMTARLVILANYAKTSGADGILFTCSAFGPAVDVAQDAVGLPTFKPNAAMFEEAIEICGQRRGEGRIGLLTTFAPATDSMREELSATVALNGLPVEIVSACAAGAMDAMHRGDARKHDQLILECARAMPTCDVLMLGQYSMARGQGLLASELGTAVLTSPASAVRKLRAAIGAAR